MKPKTQCLRLHFFTLECKLWTEKRTLEKTKVIQYKQKTNTRGIYIMEMFLSFLGFFTGITATVYLIHSLIKRNGNAKKASIALVLSLILFFSSGSIAVAKEEAKIKAPIATVPGETETEKVEPLPDPTKEELVKEKEAQKIKDQEMADQAVKDAEEALNKEKAEKENKILEDAYTIKIVDQTTRWSEDFYEFSDLMQNSQIGVDTWSYQVVLVLNSMSGLIEEARGLTPPMKYKEMNAVYLKAVDEYEMIPLKLPEAIDNMDPTLMNKITESIEKGNVYITEATNILTDLNK